MPASKAEYNFGHGDRHEYSIIAAQDIAQFADATPGIYSWHYRLSHRVADRIADMRSYDRIYAAKTYGMTAQAPLGETLTGKMRRQPFTDNRDPEFSPAALAAAVVFCPSLYIGISIDIQRRLRTHYKLLIDFLAQQSALAVPESVETEDSDGESSAFAERIGSLLRDNNIGDPGRLFVKVVYVPGASLRELQQAEFFVNRAFVPLCGRL